MNIQLAVNAGVDWVLLLATAAAVDAVSDWELLAPVILSFDDSRLSSRLAAKSYE